ncbi:hypothetical protein GCM10009069_17260 [Algimonas arctica]|uniref:Uncharacterized protein n=1 Tax=Algimonas arctica TaxID=1479486 RepID=A0A8J3CRH0_9PROT|nr:thioesterase family protein [Algimonas arctica]GHA94815.1 hypothetical protein GCM10009069_17260 [Algimonas arctica]
MTDNSTGLNLLSGYRIDPRWLNRDLYHQAVSVRPRFQDLDPLNQVNNVAMAALFEDARVQFNHPMRKHFQTKTVRTMVAGQTLNYINECHLRPALTFHMGIGKIGTSSWVMQACAYQDETPVLLAIATMVATQGGKACPIPETLHAMISERRMLVPE